MAKIVDEYTIISDRAEEVIDLRTLAKLDTTLLKSFVDAKLKDSREELEAKVKANLKESFNALKEAAINTALAKQAVEIANTNAKLLTMESKNEANAKVKVAEATSTLKQELSEMKTKSAETKLKYKTEAMRLEAQIKVNDDAKKLQKMELEKEIRAEYDSKIIKQQAEIERLNQTRQVLNIKTHGNNFEDWIHEMIFEENDPEVVTQVKEGQSGTDFIYKVKDNGIHIGTIAIECKDPQMNNDFDKKWIDKLIKDGAKVGARYKIITTYASPTSAHDNKAYWVADKENSVYVVRPEYLKTFINLFKHVIVKENMVEGMKSSEEALEKINKLNSFLRVELPQIQESMKKRKEDIEKKCETIDKATIKIRDEARKIAENDIKKIIKAIQEI